MSLTEKQQKLLKSLPGVDHLLGLAQNDEQLLNLPKSVIVKTVRGILGDTRKQILKNPDFEESLLSEKNMLEKVKLSATGFMDPNLQRVINGTGVVVHTNLGRSLLAREAMTQINEIAVSYSNLEFDLEKGARGLRYTSVEEIICEITGCESAIVVNNNAGAVLLALDTIAKGHEVIVSRGELVEIGGSFRVPDVMEKSGGILKEVGTTNRTHPKDYRNAINEKTGLLLKVHTSNYSVVGFTKSVSLSEMVEIGKESSIPVMEDLGSGTLIDFSRYGLPKEPTVQESIASGADIVTFSGDKLLGGPQAGIIAGRKDVIQEIKKNPLLRALRIDKLTLAALESTLKLYLDQRRAVEAIPTLKMLFMTESTISAKARKLSSMLEERCGEGIKVSLLNLASRAGGGSLPLLTLPTWCLGIKAGSFSCNAVERFMRQNKPAVIGRIEDDMFIIDLRTVDDSELEIVTEAFEKLINQ